MSDSTYVKQDDTDSMSIKIRIENDIDSRDLKTLIHTLERSDLEFEVRVIGKIMILPTTNPFSEGEGQKMLGLKIENSNG